MKTPDVKAVVAGVIQRHLDARLDAGHGPVDARLDAGPADRHPSFQRFHAPRASDEAGGDGRCVIEPAVACEQSGYCRLRGH